MYSLGVIVAEGKGPIDSDFRKPGRKAVQASSESKEGVHVRVREGPLGLTGLLGSQPTVNH